MPLANSYVAKEDAKKEEFECPLSVTRCSDCGLVQLTHVVPPERMFTHYLYVSSTTKTFQEHFSQYAKTLKKKHVKKDNLLAVDIGSNDGFLLSCYQKEGMKAVGVEPASNLSQQANQQGLTTIQRFFDAECVREIHKRFGAADVVSANNVFAHIDDIQSVLRNVRELMNDTSIFVIEFPYLLTMVEEFLFDMIYHEHLSYISMHPLQRVLGRFGFEIFDVQYVPSHGGSLRVFIQKKGGPYAVSAAVQNYLEREKKGSYLTEAPYQKFAAGVRKCKEDFMSFVRKIQAAGSSIAGYGAPAKASTIINYYELTFSDIAYVVDDNPLKQNWLIPGAKIPIMPSAYGEEHPTSYLVIFAWNFAREILQKVKHWRRRGLRFLVPVPIASKLSGTAVSGSEFEIELPEESVV
jgi:SAM-dependent methyltransferase